MVEIAIVYTAKACALS